MNKSVEAAEVAAAAESSESHDAAELSDRERARIRKQNHDRKLRNRGQQVCPDEPERFGCVIHLSSPAKAALTANRRNSRTLGVGPILDSKYIEQLLLEDVERGRGFLRAAKGRYQPRHDEAANLAHLVSKIQSLERSNRELAAKNTELRAERARLRTECDDAKNHLEAVEDSNLADSSKSLLGVHTPWSAAFESLARSLFDSAARCERLFVFKREAFEAVKDYIQDLGGYY